jgi:fused signal recognition particle receptor
MRAFVRLLPRLLLLAVAAVALLVLAERERSAHADVLPPLTTPPPPSAPAPDPTTPPSLPAPPPLPAPTLPPAPEPSLTGAVAPLRSVPEVAPPEPLVLDLPPVPDLTDVPMVTLARVLELGAAPAPDAPAVADAPGAAPSPLLAEPLSAPLDASEPGGFLVGAGADFAAARAPPVEAPGSPHPCPVGGSPHPTQTDVAPFPEPEPAACEAPRGASSRTDARAYASTLLCDPLLRPD